MASKAPKPTLQVIMEKIHEVLRVTEGRKFSSEKLSPEVKGQVDQLEKMVNDWTDASNQLLALLGSTPEEASALASKPIPYLSEVDAQAMKYSNEVLRDARRKYAEVSMLMRAIKQRGQADTRTGGQKVLGKSRQKKFRRFGGKGDWMPM